MREFVWLAGAGLVWYLIAYVLLPVPAVRSEFDESWRAFLTWAFEHGRQFGTDVIFTYGPWGFLLEPRGTPGIYPWQILGRLVLALGASSGIALLGQCWIRPARLRWIWAGAIVLLAEPATLIPVLLYLITAPGIRFRWKTAVLLTVACAAGLAACTKFTCFVLLVPLLPLLAGRKELAAVLATTVSSFFIFWLLAGQSIANVPAFIRQSIEVTGGYSAMVSGRPWVVLPLALVVCGLPLLQLGLRMCTPFDAEKLARLGWLAFCEFMIFRHGLIRSDTYHSYMAFLTLGVPILLLLIRVPDGPVRLWPQYWDRAYAAILVWALLTALLFARQALIEKSALFASSFRAYPSFAREWISEDNVGPLLSDDEDSADVFPDDIAYAIRKGLPIRNRPVFQAALAFTTAICRQNAALLEGPKAPRTIYFRSHSVDNEYPTTQDSLAWRSLLTHYAPAGVTSGTLVLRRRKQPAEYEMRLIGQSTIRMGEALAIPEAPGGLVWAELHTRRTFTGGLLNLLFRVEKLWLRVDTARQSNDFSLRDETSGGRFLLSPTAREQAAVLDLYQPESRRYSAEQVQRIMVHGDGLASFEHEPNLEVRLCALILKGPPLDIPDTFKEALANGGSTPNALGITP